MTVLYIVLFCVYFQFVNSDMSLSAMSSSSSSSPWRNLFDSGWNQNTNTGSNKFADGRTMVTSLTPTFFDPEINMNHLIDYLHSMKKSQDLMANKIEELTRLVESRGREEQKSRVNVSRKIAAMESKILEVEQSLPYKIEEIYDHKFPPADELLLAPKRTRDLSNYVIWSDGPETSQQDSNVKLMEESKKTMQQLNSTLEHIKKNIYSMEAHIRKVNVSRASDVDDKVTMLTNQQRQLNETVGVVASQFQSHNVKMEKTMQQLVDMKKHLNNFKTTVKKQIQNISTSINSWKRDDSTALALVIDELYMLQKQIQAVGETPIAGDNQTPGTKVKSLTDDAVNNVSFNYALLLKNLTEELKLHKEQIRNLTAEILKVNVSQILLQRSVNDETLKKTIRPKDCSEIGLFRNGTSGIYTIFPVNDYHIVEVVCDLDTDGGGWTVIQRRGYPVKHNEVRVPFFRNWTDYEIGFGSVHQDFWLGLSNIAALCMLGDQELRIDLTDWEGETRHAIYKHFRIASADDAYRLQVSEYSGNAGDSFSRHNDMRFSTWDRDNDLDLRRNCAQTWKGAWWYYGCHESNLNGVYAQTGSNGIHDFGTGIVWYHWKGNNYSLRTVEMKIRNNYVIY